jgi:hypothetical protein
MSSNRVAGRSATTSAKVADLEMARINALLDRLDPKIGEPGGIPGEIILSPGRAPNELVAA